MEASVSLERIQRVRERFPAEGLFAQKEWLLSPEPFFISPDFASELERLGHWLLKFVKATNQLYQLSATHKQPEWVAKYLDIGKPQQLVELGRRNFHDIPHVIRPDLILTDSGYIISELDSVPGGIGLTGWLNETYRDLGFDVVGGADGMIEGFRSILPTGAILLSKESDTYRPEMEWIRNRMTEGYGPHWTVGYAENWESWADQPVYRFFELFDLPNIPTRRSLLAAAETGELRITPPLKPYLEEKLWFALFWSRPLQKFWRRQLREMHWLKLKTSIPQSWVIDPSPVPHYAVIPGLEIQDWRELKSFSQREREFVLKISGFSELSWGSRGVFVGQDLPQKEWSERVEESIASFGKSPYLLQRFIKGGLVEQPYYNSQSESIERMKGRVRLCPYYFVTSNSEVKLGGALATIVPADKKLVHGMSDAILVPAAVRSR